VKRRSTDKDWVPTNEDEVNLFEILMIQESVQKSEMDSFHTTDC